MHSVDLFWSFRSPYSYLSTRRIVAMAAEYEIVINFRVVHPLAIREPEFFERTNPMLHSYVRMDAARVADFLGIPFKWPDPDPVVVDVTIGKFASEQPYIHRLSRLGVEAARRGRGLAFADEVSRVLWGGEIKNWHEGEHLALVAERAGLSLPELEKAIQAQDANHDKEILENHAALEKAGHWGVPTLVFEQEPFFGQDRIDLCLWRLRQQGLTKRTVSDAIELTRRGNPQTDQTRLP